MSADPICVTPETLLKDAARLMDSNDIGMLPVVDGDRSARLLGLVTDRDITVRHVAKGHKGGTCKVREAMTESVRSCAPDADIADVMDLMAHEQVRRIPVVDERDLLVGVIAQADIVRKADDTGAAEHTIQKISEP
jgi:CBS domain-containing protein